MSYTQKAPDELKARYPEQPEFIQAATEILGTIQPALDAHPEYEEAALLSASSSPERIVIIPCPLGRRPGQGPGQPRLPRRVQLRHRTLQGRPAL